MKQLINRIPVVNVLARWLHRRVGSRRSSSIVRDRLKRFQEARPLRIVVGASGIYDSGWIDTDIEYLNLLNRSHWETYFPRNSIDAILAEHVWEHLTIEEGRTAARTCYEYLKPGGYLRVAVPDGFHPDASYQDYVKPGGTGAGALDHKVLYNHETFAEIFEQAGFRVELLEYFDVDGEFHCVDWSPASGTIVRSRRFDERNRDGTLKYTSIIVDAHKEAAAHPQAE